MDNISALITQGKLEEAQASLKSLEGESAHSAPWHLQWGNLLEAKGEHEEALAALEQAVEIDGDCTEAVFRLAYLHDLFGDEAHAMELYESLEQVRPTHVNALLNLAVIYEDQDRSEDALDCVERVLAEYPRHARAQLFCKDIESAMDMHYDETQERTQAKHHALLDTSVADFELSVRSRNCLKKMNIHTLGDLLKTSEAELLAYKNFGDTSLTEIKIMLDARGLHLGQLREEGADPPRTVTPHHPGSGTSGDVACRYLTEIEFSGRSRKCLQRLGLVTLTDLISKTETELLSTKNFGQTSLTEIKTKLVELGLSLRKKPD